jgi:hypothetical protein
MPGIVSGLGNLAGAVVRAPFQVVSTASRAILGSKKKTKAKRGRNSNKRTSRKSRGVRRRSKPVRKVSRRRSSSRGRK